MINSIPPTDRRSEILDAAIRAFARKGYGGSTLADIAVEAGVSQPRISQVFGTKENAFVEAYLKAAGEILDMIRAHAQPPYERKDLGDAYQALVNRRPEIFLMIFQGLTSFYVPAIGRTCRWLITEIVDIVTGSGGTPEDARDLLERAFFVHAMMASAMVDHVPDHPGVQAMLASVGLGREAANPDSPESATPGAS
ncbi:MAG TPA: TetR/AcrR family transcriptional regulator [Propionibacterium sp.]|nr:TetR/AcrR family transcriptional regulator [Propionibacterium sp.]